MKKNTFVLVLFGCAAFDSPISMASDFQSAMPTSLRSNIQQPSVNTPNKSAQTMMQTTTGSDSTPMSQGPTLPLRGISGNQKPVNSSPVNLGPNSGGQEPYSAPPVSTFFKINSSGKAQPTAGTSKLNTLPSQATLNSVVQKNGSAAPNVEATSLNAKEFSPGKMIWHVLDNMGVPMFIGKDNDLAPGLERSAGMPDKAYFLPNQARISDKTVGTKPKLFQIRPKHTQLAPAGSNSASTSSSDITVDSKAHDEKPRSPLEKIPQSELEGVSPTDSTDNDAQTTKP